MARLHYGPLRQVFERLNATSGNGVTLICSLTRFETGRSLFCLIRKKYKQGFAPLGSFLNDYGYKNGCGCRVERSECVILDDDLGVTEWGWSIFCPAERVRRQHKVLVLI